MADFMYCEVFLNSLLRSDGMVAAAAVEAVGKRHIRACCGTVEKAVDTAMQQDKKRGAHGLFHGTAPLIHNSISRVKII